MAKHYVQFLAVFICFLVTSLSFSQSNETKKSIYGTIEGLTIYPNPVSNGKLYISSTKNLSKSIQIFDVLGKKIYDTGLFGNALDISRLNTVCMLLK